MKSYWTLRIALLLLALTVPATLLAEDIPLSNWTVPAYHPSSSGGGITTMADITPAVAFVGITPCRLVDTRAGSGFPAGFGPPSLAAGVPRNFDLNSQPNCTGIPASVEAYSLNFTVTNVQGPGFLKVFPQGGAIPVDISTLNYIPGQNIANAAIVPAGTGGGITVISGVSGTDLIIDINGYFSDSGNTDTEFVWVTTDLTEAMFIENLSTTSGEGLHVESHSLSTGFATVFGDNDAVSTTAITYGVWGDTDSTFTDSAGVLGTGGHNTVNTTPNFPTAGVRGEDGGAGIGVLGLTENFDGTHAGLVGALINNSTGATVVDGYIGARVCPFGCQNLAGWFNGNLHVNGNLSASGTKPFIEPTATDPLKMIKYIAMEGPEAGTYFRGRARFSRGLARIAVPAHFKEVSDPDSLSVQITPIGEMASFAVVRADLDEVVVKSSRNVEFYYQVNSVRRAYVGHEPIQESTFLPLSADYRMPEEFPQEIRRRLIAAGVYNADGTPNMETMERIGLVRLWKERADQAAARATAAAATER